MALVQLSAHPRWQHLTGVLMASCCCRQAPGLSEAVSVACSRPSQGCKFLHSADLPVASLQAILEATQLKDDPQSSVQRVVVTGCMAQRYASDLSAAIPEADLFVGFQNYDGLPASIREALAAPSGGAARPAKRQRVQVGPLGLQPHCVVLELPKDAFSLLSAVRAADQFII